MGRPVFSVLLVEDDEGEALLIEKMLIGANDATFDVKHVVTLRNALTVIHAIRPDIVLLDLSLPDFHGYDTVVEYTKNCNTPFIVLTGNDDMQMAIRAVNLGAEDYLLKNDLQARKLEMALTVACGKAAAKSVRRRLEHTSRTVVMGGRDKATISMVTPYVGELLESFGDLEEYLRKNAPHLMEDVLVIMRKHDVHRSIKEIRDLLQLHEDRRTPVNGPSRQAKISDSAIQAVEEVYAKRSTPESSPPVSFQAAEADVLEVLSRRESISHE